MVSEWDASDLEEEHRVRTSTDDWVRGRLSGTCEMWECRLETCRCAVLSARMFDLIAALAHLQPVVVFWHRCEWIETFYYQVPTYVDALDRCELALVRPADLRRWKPPRPPGRLDAHDTICHLCMNSHRECYCARVGARIAALAEAVICLRDLCQLAMDIDWLGEDAFGRDECGYDSIDEYIRACPLAFAGDGELRDWSPAPD